MRPELRGLAIADPPEPWRALGFTVADGVVALGGIAAQLGAAGSGIAGWELSGANGEVDGLPVCALVELPNDVEHPNGAVGLDHVVVVTPDFARTAGALASAGLELRRVIDGPRGQMGFRRLGAAILEVVARDDVPAGPARFWGLVVVVRDLDAVADRLGPIRDAVQPGRRIATVPREAGLSTAVAFMSA